MRTLCLGGGNHDATLGGCRRDRSDRGRARRLRARAVEHAGGDAGCRADDTAETLSARILIEEHRLYPEAVRTILDGGWSIDGRRFVTAPPAR